MRPRVALGLTLVYLTVLNPDFTGVIRKSGLLYGPPSLRSEEVIFCPQGPKKYDIQNFVILVTNCIGKKSPVQEDLECRGGPLSITE